MHKDARFGREKHITHNLILRIVYSIYLYEKKTVMGVTFEVKKYWKFAAPGTWSLTSKFENWKTCKIYRDTTCGGFLHKSMFRIYVSSDSINNHFQQVDLHSNLNVRQRMGDEALLFAFI